MKETIKNRIPIHVDLAPIRDELYSGICLKSNDEVFIFVCFNDEIKEFDGFAIIRNYEIEKDNSSDFIDKLPLEKMNTMSECLSQLEKEKLISIFIESDDDSYYVGRIKNVFKNKVKLKLLNEDAEWIGTKKIKTKKVTYIGFQTTIENDLLNKILLKNPSP